MAMYLAAVPWPQYHMLVMLSALIPCDFWWCAGAPGLVRCMASTTTSQSGRRWQHRWRQACSWSTQTCMATCEYGDVHQQPCSEGGGDCIRLGRPAIALAWGTCARLGFIAIRNHFLLSNKECAVNTLVLKVMWMINNELSQAGAHVSTGSTWRA